MNEHNVCGFTCYRASQYPEHEKKPFVYSGPNVMDKFYDHIMTERSQICVILNDKKPIDVLDDEQQAEFDRATECYDCNEAFTEDNYKVRHHDHVSGKYIAPACRDCNIDVLKFQQRNRKATQGHENAKNSKLDNEVTEEKSKKEENYVENFSACCFPQLEMLRCALHHQTFQEKVHRNRAKT